jgi:hypothetical protein
MQPGHALDAAGQPLGPSPVPAGGRAVISVWAPTPRAGAGRAAAPRILELFALHHRRMLRLD